MRKVIRKVLRYLLYLVEVPVGRKGMPRSKSDLVALERHLGGTHRGVPTKNVSPLDRRGRDELGQGMIGGDKMFFHQYADIYLSVFRHLEDPKVIAEIGILKGAGLALLSFIFPHAKLYGFDIDPSHFENFKEPLKAKGAFEFGDPEIVFFDQLQPELDSAAMPMFDLIIDDGLHSQTAIDKTLEQFLPLLSNGGVYVIEDLPVNYEISADLIYGYRYLQFEEVLVIFNDTKG